MKKIAIGNDHAGTELKNKIISKKDYDMAYRIGNKLLKEIESNSNKYMNVDVLQYINKYFI